MELKLTKMVEEVRDGCKREIQSATDSQSQKLLEVQKSTKHEMDKLRAEHRASHDELKKMSQDTQKDPEKDGVTGPEHVRGFPKNDGRVPPDAPEGFEANRVPLPGW